MTNKLIIGIAGYTKSGKTTLSNLLDDVFDCQIQELSDFITAETGTKSIEKALLLKQQRALLGNDILARLAIENFSDEHTIEIISGLRSYEDYKYLKKECENFVSIFIHITHETVISRNSLKHKELTPDFLKNLGKMEDEQGIGEIAKNADFIIVNDDYYPLSFEEQVDGLKNGLLGIVEANTTKSQMSVASSW